MSEQTTAEKLQKGIRAVRRGRGDAAVGVLREVVTAEPQNELAWLWLARATSDPQQETEALRQVLALNPENKWAAEQLAEVKSTAVSPPAAAPEKTAVPSPTAAKRTLAAINCPNCNASVKLRLGAETKTVACAHCGSIVDLTPAQAAVIGQKKRQSKPAQPIELGMTGTFDDTEYMVVGWLRYRGTDGEEYWYWDEWLLASTEGQFAWLSFDTEEGFALQQKQPIKGNFNPRTAGTIPVHGGKQVPVRERGRAQIVALAGELTWQAKVGDQIRYIDARSGDQRYSVEFTDEEIELTVGRALATTAVWRAFGRDDLLQKAEEQADARRLYRVVAGIMTAFTVIGLLFATFAAVNGRNLTEQQNTLINAGDVITLPFEVTRPNRPHQVSVRTGSLPTNSWAVVNVYLQDPYENEYYLFSEEFWDEEGRDSDGYWHESDLNGRFLFRPDEAGPYELTVELDSTATNVNSVAVTTRVRGGIWLSRYYIIFSVFAGALIFVFAAMSKERHG